MSPSQYDIFTRRMAVKRGVAMSVDTAAQGLCSEAGEVAGLVKKVWERDQPIDRTKMLHELGDTAFYLSVMAQRCGFSLEEVLSANVDKLEQRFPERVK